ncbi:MAG: hypothetical protein OXR84_04200 [Magnetovibrio sp.]|nr:hypothetical protein [Magnetovibrio sp.]
MHDALRLEGDDGPLAATFLAMNTVWQPMLAPASTAIMPGCRT